jgi:hypothetical protein
MMSWERPENINKIISIYQEYNCIDEIIIWNNHPHFYISNLNLSKVKALNASTDFGLNTRFIGALLASNRCIITHDDDILLSETNIKNLIHHFEKDYTRIYTYEGRIPQDGLYTCNPGPGRIEQVKEPTEVDIALTRTTCFDKLYAAEYCKLSDVVFYDVNNNLNGEDIVFSYITSHSSGKKPLVLPIPDKDGYVELPAPLDTKISTRPNFIERRINLVNRCQLLFPTPKYPTPDNNKTIFFGNGFYPYAYYRDSFIVNSDYKKLLIKDNLNGIKYLSCNTTDKYDWTIFYIDTNSTISANDKIIIKSFFKDHVIPVDLELNFLDKGLEINTNRVRVDIGADFISETYLKIGDYFTCSDETILTSIKFVLYTKNRPCSELCLTEFSLEHNNAL